MGKEKYFLAFDIECSQTFGGPHEICLFGYVKTDSLLNEVGSGEIYVKANRPQGRVKKLLKNVDFEKVVKAPGYEHQHDIISDILNSENTILVAHSGDSDLRFMYLQNERYGLENFSGSLLDTFLLVRERYQSMENYGVIGLTEAWRIGHELEHDALSDARSCIDFIRHICEEDNITPLQLYEKYKDTACVKSEIVYRDIDRQRIIREVKKMAVDEAPPGTVCFCFDFPFEKAKRADTTGRLAEMIIKAGGAITFRAPKFDYIIADEGSESKRIWYAVNIAGAKAITPDEVEDLITKNGMNLKTVG